MQICNIGCPKDVFRIRFAEKQPLLALHVGKRYWAGVSHMSLLVELDMRFSPSYRHAAPGALWILEPQLSAHTKVNNIQPNNRN
jgi:hypothetical protein